MPRWIAALILPLAIISFARAQAPDDRTRVNPEDSNDAVRQLRLVDAYVDQGSWTEAIDLLASVIETYPHQVLPLPGSNPRRYLSVRDYGHQRIAAMPADAMTLYRERVDGPARALFEQFEESGDESIARKIVAEYYLSSYSDRAIEILGDRDLSEGRLDSACRWWEQLLESPSDRAGGASTGLYYPDPKNDLGRLRAKWTLAQLWLGERAAAERGRQILAERFPDAFGELAGRAGRYVDIVTAFAADEAAQEPAIESPDWQTFGGDFTRGKIAPRAIRVGTVQHRWTLPEGDWSGPDRAEVDINPRFLQLARTPQRPTPQALYLHPVTTGKEVFVSDGQFLYWFDIDQEEPTHKFNLSLNNDENTFPSGQNSRHTLTVAGNLLFVRTGDTASNANPGFPGRSVRSPSLLFCFDHREKRLLWWVNAATAGLGPQAIFEGAPVVSRNRAYIGVTRVDAMSTVHVVSLNVKSGEIEWNRLICEATHDWMQSASPDQNLLTLGDDTIYYCTNLGAIAAIDLAGERVKWLTEYNLPAMDFSRPGNQDVNPCVYYHRRLFAAPAGTNSLLCLDADTGQINWQSRVPAEQVLGVADGNVIVAGDRVYALEVDTGAVVWQFPENKPRSVGRGLLAGGNVYWLTATEIHVLDQATGRRAEAAVSLLEGLHVKPGNLIPGDGFALLAENRQIAVLRPYTWLKQQRERLVAEEPTSATAHLLLAEACGWNGDRDDAIDHFRQAIEYASPHDIHNGRPLAEESRRQLHEILLASARSIAEDAEPQSQLVDSADEYFARAAVEATTDDERWKALAERAHFLERMNRPQQSVEIWHAILANEEFANALVANSGHRVAIRQFVDAELWKLRSQQPDEIFRPYDEAFAEAIGGDLLTPAEYLTSARRWPTAKSRAGALTKEAERLAQDDQRSAAIALLIEANRTESSSSPDLIAAERLFLAVEEPSRSADDDFRNVSSVEKPADWLIPAWITRRRETAVLLPTGPTAERSEPTLFTWRSGQLSGCERDTGRTLWTVTAPQPTTNPARHADRTIFDEGTRVVCRRAASGEIVWEHPIDQPGKKPWSAVDSKIESSVGTFECTTPQEITSPGRIVVRAGAVDVLGTDGILRRFDPFDGRLLMEADVLARWGQPRKAGERIQTMQPIDHGYLMSTDHRVFRMAFDGTLAWTVPVRHVLGPTPAAVFDDRIVLVTGRDAITCVDSATGAQQWTYRSGWPSWDVPAIYREENALVALIDGYQLMRIDPNSGVVVWQVAANKRPAKGQREDLILSKSSVILGGPAGLTSRSLETGELKWRASDQKVTHLREHGPVVAGISRTGTQWAVSRWDLDSGTKVGDVPIPFLDDESCIRWTEGGVLFTNADETLGWRFHP